MSDLTPERLAEMRRIAEAATPGPWTATHSDGDYFKLVGADDVSIIDGCGCCGSPWLDGIDPDADARFLAEFHREQVLTMLAEIERLRRERETLAEAVRAMKYFFDSDYSDPEESATLNWSYAHQKWLEALALLDDEGGDSNGGADPDHGSPRQS